MSWKDKLANKSATPQPQITINNEVTNSSAGGWRSKLQDPTTQPPPRVTTIDVNDSQAFPSLSSKPTTNASNTKPALTGYAALASEWAASAKEDAAREAAERAQQEQQERLYNYSSMNALNAYAINSKLMSFSGGSA